MKIFRLKIFHNNLQFIRAHLEVSHRARYLFATALPVLRVLVAVVSVRVPYDRGVSVTYRDQISCHTKH